MGIYSLYRVSYVQIPKTCEGEIKCQSLKVGKGLKRIKDGKVKTGTLLIAQIHGYLLGLKSMKTLIVGLQKI
jgi:hypothetical protein